MVNFKTILKNKSMKLEFEGNLKLVKKKLTKLSSKDFLVMSGGFLRDMPLMNKLIVLMWLLIAIGTFVIDASLWTRYVAVAAFATIFLAEIHAQCQRDLIDIMEMQRKIAELGIR